MKYIVQLLVVMLFIGCDQPDSWDCVKNTGDRVTERISFPSKIDTLSIYDDINIVLHNGIGQYFELISGKNVLPNIQVDRSENAISFVNKNTCNWARNSNSIELHIYSDTALVINKDGSGTISSTEPLNFSLAIKTTISGKVDLILNSDYLKMEVLSLVNTNIQGNLNRLSLYISGQNSIFQGENCTINNASIVQGGFNSIHTDVVNKLEYSIWNSGDIFIYREPQELILNEKSGKGQLIRNF